MLSFEFFVRRLVFFGPGFTVLAEEGSEKIFFSYNSAEIRFDSFFMRFPAIQEEDG